MATQYVRLVDLKKTASRVNSLRADFSGLENLNKIIEKVLLRLQVRGDVTSQLQSMAGTGATLDDFDGWFEPIVRKELGKTLGIIRNKIVKKAENAGAKESASAVSRRMYKDRMMANVNILGNRKRLSSKERPYPTPTGGKSGIRRPRSVSQRTKKLYGYAPVDRAFILRFLEFGTDIRTARPEGATGRRSKATYGNRGSIGARSFFGGADNDARQAAQELGTTLINYVEKWLDEEFESNNS